MATNGEADGWYDPTKIWTTLLTNRGYFGGLLVLNHSLRRHKSKYRLVVMVTRAVEEDTEYMEAFAAAGIPTIVVDKIEPAPRDGKINKGTWEKLAPWSFTQYEVYSIYLPLVLLLLLLLLHLTLWCTTHALRKLANISGVS